MSTPLTLASSHPIGVDPYGVSTLGPQDVKSGPTPLTDFGSVVLMNSIVHPFGSRTAISVYLDIY